MITRHIRFFTKLVLGLFTAILMVTSVATAGGGIDNLVTLEAHDASLTSVLQTLTEKSGLNIITGHSVEERRISIRIKNVPVEEAIALVVKAAGLGYARVGSSILVETGEVLGEDASLSPYVIKLDYADAVEVQEMLQDLSPHIQVDIGGNQLVIRANPKARREISKIIKEIDKPPVQVMLRAKLIEVQVDALARMGIDWDKLNSITTVVTEGIPEPSAPNALPENMPFEIRDITKSTLSRQLEVFQITLDLLINEGSAEILADTKLATLNNREATIHIGDIVPYVITGYGGLTEELQVEREEVGIKLRITPHVNDDGYITTRVEPEVSTIVGWVGPNNEIPWVKTRTATTTVRVKDGETIIIAGLLSEEETTQISKVPLLGDLPLLGKLFQHTVKNKKKTDLIIEITPKVLED
ncbi:hypothetical protein KAX22_07800 [bacterium]|nr:hypothetical protein [bacterium]